MIKLENGMVLYHGSYCAVENPDLEKCADLKDFGRGFYLTTSKSQAKSFALISLFKAKGKGLVSPEKNCGYISYYKVSNVENLKTFCFENAGSDWLHCVVAHRKNGIFAGIRKKMKPFDVIAGKIANDDTNTTIIAYMSNLYGTMGTERADSFCISLLLPDRLKDQFCFRSEKAVAALQYLKSEKVVSEKRNGK